VQTPSSERPVPPKPPRVRAAALIGSVADAAAARRSGIDRDCCRRSCGGEAALIESVADAAASVSFTSDRAISGADTEQRGARAAALIESVADAAAAASVTPDRAISGADTEQRAACAAQASEGESSSFDRERCRRSCGAAKRH